MQSLIDSKTLDMENLDAKIDALEKEKASIQLKVNGIKKQGKSIL